MKLYTEEQVKEIYFKGVHNGRLHIEGKCSDEVELLIPIELPSDEEIKKMMEVDGMEFDEFDPYDVSYLGGATWMRNLIQGGEH
jgi:putative methionine-R-sulfoxide reductase with GAF domain